MAAYEIIDGVGIIPEGTTKIESYAFVDCKDLMSITIPDSVTEIGGGAFRECTGLTSVVIGNSVTEIGYDAFYGCTGLTNIVIPNSVTKIGTGAFNGCTGLTSIFIPDSVETISAFKGCTNLTSLVVSDGNKVYDSRDNCNAIIETTTNTLVVGCSNTIIPKSVTKIARIAFGECRGLTNLAIPKSVAEIGDSAFEDCSDLTSIIIPPSVKKIDSSTFSGCTSLTKVVIPKSVTRIKEKAFDGCSSLTDIVLPNSVEEIGDWAFSGCSSLTNITIPKSLRKINGCLFKGCTALTNVVIPKSVEKIDSWAFEDCTNLSELVIPNSVKTIESGIVWGCPKITHIEIPASVTDIDKDALSRCENLTSIVVSKKNKVYDSRDNCNAIIRTAKNKLFITCAGTTMIPESVTSISPRVFSNYNNLISIEIPESVQTIGENAFEECESLETVTFKGCVENMEEDVFFQCPNLKSIFVPDGKTEFYKERLDDELWDYIVEPSMTSRERETKVAETSHVYQTLSGVITVSIGDLFAEGEMYLDQDAYVSRFRYWGEYSVVAIYEHYVIIDNGEQRVKLYPNTQSDYFSELPPVKFKKQWEYDKYYPRYYVPISSDGSIRQPEPSAEKETDQPMEDVIVRKFVIDDKTWDEDKVISVMNRQFKKLYPNRSLDVIEFEYEEQSLEGPEYYFNILADGYNFQAMISSCDGNIHWDKSL